MTADRIGVTGHRWNRLIRPKADALRHALVAAFHAIDRQQTRPRTLVCGMAEGTDLLAAACRPPNWGLEAALPLPVPAWRAHLAGQERVDEGELDLFDRMMAGAECINLPGAKPAPGFVGPDFIVPDFMAVARHIASTCDHLVAVWDGAPGKPGGAGDVVRLTRARGRTVTVIDARPFQTEAPD